MICTAFESDHCHGSYRFDRQHNLATCFDDNTVQLELPISWELDCHLGRF